MPLSNKILVVGGSGLVGRAIQDYARDHETEDDFVFTYCHNRRAIRPGMQGIKLDLSKDDSRRLLRKYETAVYVAGSPDHSLPDRDPNLALDFQVRTFLNFAKHFQGDLVLLSSQAVYYGLVGETREDVDHVSMFPYGFLKQTTENYSRYFWAKGILTSLSIFRLMYTFGKSERRSRLIPRCVESARRGKEMAVQGKGASYLNPLPSELVAEILVTASKNVAKEDRSFRVTNLNNPERIRVLDIVKYLCRVSPFPYKVEAGGETWPVRFWGNTRRLKRLLNRWGISVPDVWESLKEEYLRELHSG